MKKLLSTSLCAIMLLSLAVCVNAAPTNLMTGNVTIDEREYPIAIADLPIPQGATKQTLAESNYKVWDDEGSTMSDNSFNVTMDADGSKILENTVGDGAAWKRIARFNGAKYITGLNKIQIWEVKFKLPSTWTYQGEVALFGYNGNTDPDFNGAITIKNALDTLSVVAPNDIAFITNTEGDHKIDLDTWYTARRIIKVVNPGSGAADYATVQTYDSIYDEAGTTLIGSTNAWVEQSGKVKTGYAISNSNQYYWNNIAFQSRYCVTTTGLKLKDFNIYTEKVDYNVELKNLPQMTGDGQFIEYKSSSDANNATIFQVGVQGWLQMAGTNGTQFDDGYKQYQTYKQKILFRDPAKTGAETSLFGVEYGNVTGYRHKVTYMAKVKDGKLYAYNNGQYTTEITALDAFKWYNFKAELDISTGVATISVYDEMNTLVNSGSTTGYSSRPYGQDARILGVGFFYSNTMADTIYVDDLSVKCVSEPNVIQNNTYSATTATFTFDGAVAEWTRTGDTTTTDAALAEGSSLDALQGGVKAGRAATVQPFSGSATTKLVTDFVGNKATDSSSAVINLGTTEIDEASVPNGIYIKNAEGNKVAYATYNSADNTATVSFTGLKDGNYTLMIDKNLKTKTFGIPADSYEYGFTIASGFTVNSLGAYMGADMVSGSLMESGAVKAKVNITRDADAECTSAVLMIAVYDGTKLVGVDVENITITEGTKDYETETGVSGAVGNTVKAYLWDGLSTLKPLI